MENHLSGSWQNTLQQTRGYSYICGYCGTNAGPSIKYKCDSKQLVTVGEIFLCPICNKPTFINKEFKEQVPGPRLGQNIEFLPQEIELLYNEARNCISINANTSAVLACRKLLMNVAVSLQAESGKSFVFYVTYLEENHFIPPNSKEWVDHIRKKGNEATHEIPSIDKDEAVELLEFTEMLLRFVYEMPGKMTKYRK